MGEHETFTRLEEDGRRDFVRALLDDVKALEHMIDHGLIESDVKRIGAEQEYFLVDSSCEASPVAGKVLATLDDPAFTTELALFNLEANLPPYRFQADCLARMERDLDRLLGQLRVAAAAHGADVLLAGILPTLQPSDLHVGNMTQAARYTALNEAMVRMRGREFYVGIKGIDEFHMVCDSVMLEGCNTSFQVHCQVGADEFARKYNLAQAITGPVLAVAANSPVLFERRLWHETRMALFQCSVDDRSHTHLARGQRPRVRFGEKWIDDSVLEIFHDDIARFRVVLSAELGEYPGDVLKRGELPRLSALCLHNGTVWRWNRACYGLHEGKAHLRIEHRPLPAGPTVIDEVANAAFFLGLLAGLGRQHEDITKVMPFDDARANFMQAARRGLQAHFTWIGGKATSARELILEELLPLARDGLEANGIDSGDIDRYLGVIEERTRVGRSGARWALESLAGMEDRGTDHQRHRALTVGMLERQKTDAPVHTWSLADLDEAADWRHSYQTVGLFMSRDLFTVQPHDVVDLAASLMDWRHIRHVPVEDEDGHLVGLVTHRDLVRYLAAGTADAEGSVTVRDIMRKDIITVQPDAPSGLALRLMEKNGIGCLPVIEDGRLVGIVTERDFLRVAAKLMRTQLEQHRDEVTDPKTAPPA
ncbi:MAG: CBS domain-containing protein [Planctomycetota bacterium]